MWRPRRNWPWSLLLLVTALPLLATIPSAADEPDGIVFFDDYQQALREAKLKKQPIFLEFRCAP